MKKGKKMPAIEIQGESEARYELRDGKIVRVEGERQREGTLGEALRSR
ncbi:MAG: hypothetical protein ACYDDF_01390 [Thermoplasmatota archaeon]